jgi:hypothetical protein
MKKKVYNNDSSPIFLDTKSSPVARDINSAAWSLGNELIFVSDSFKGTNELKYKPGSKKGRFRKGARPARLNVTTITKNTEIRVAIS